MSASVSGIRAGKAWFQLLLDTSHFKKDMQSAVNQLRTIGQSLTAAGQQLMTAGLAIVAPLALSVKTFSGFEKEMVRVGALTRASGDQLEMMTNKARQLGRETIFMAEDAARAMGVFSLAGFKVGETMNVIGPTLDLAAVGMMDVSQAADIVAKVMRGMQLDTSKTGHVVDVLAQAMATANTNLPMLGDAMRYVGPVARAMGIGIEETVAAIQLLSDAGVQGQQAGTVLRGSLLRILADTGSVAEAMKDLGAEVVMTNEGAMDFASTLQSFEQALNGMGEVEQMRALNKIFSRREITGMAIFAGKGADALREMTEQLKKADGFAQQFAAKQIDSVWGAMMIVMSSFEGVLLEVGEALMPVVRLVADFAIGWLNTASQWIKKNQGVVLGLAAIGSALTMVGGALMATGIILTGLIGVFTSLGTVLSTAWALSWNHTLLIISKVGMALFEFVPAVHHLAEEIWESIGHRAAHAFHTLEGAWGGVVNAVESQDFAAAAEIAAMGVYLAWAENTEDIRKLWVQMVAVLEGVWTVIKSGFVAVWDEGSAAATDAIRKITIGWHVFEAQVKVVADLFHDLAKIILAAIDPIATLDLTSLVKGLNGILTFNYEVFGKDKPAGRDPNLPIYQDPNALPGWVKSRNKVMEDIWNRMNADLEKGDADIEKAKHRLEELIDAMKHKVGDKRAMQFAFGGLEMKRLARGGAGGFDPNKGMEQAAKAMSTTGTFSAALARQMGGKGVAERQLKVAEENLAVNKQIRDNVKDIGKFD